MARRTSRAFSDPVGYRIVSYRERNLNLRAMGYETYAAYLASDLWKGISSRVLAASSICCA